MLSFYLVVIFICIMCMIFLALDVGNNTVLNKQQVHNFRSAFGFVVLGAICEAIGYVFNTYGCRPVWIHAVITCTEYIISPHLPLLLAKSCGIKRSMVPMSILMGVHSLLEIVCLPFNLILSIDENGFITRGPYHWIYIAFCGIVAVYIILVFIYLGKSRNAHNSASVFIIALIMATGPVANAVYDKLQTGYISICITAVLLYMYIQGYLRSQMLTAIGSEKEIANHDSLTGVSSRISFETKVLELDNLIKANPEGLKIAVCECDLNNLKLINDSFGHEAGDIYIKKCCKSICDMFKHSPVYRVGGDEFVVILQAEDLSRYEEIKFVVQNFSMIEAAKIGDFHDRISFASGFANFVPELDKSFADLLKRADMEMYDNKKQIKKLLLEN